MTKHYLQLPLPSGNIAKIGKFLPLLKEDLKKYVRMYDNAHVYA